MRVLFLSSWFPFPPDNGSKIRIYHLLRALARQNSVKVISFAEDVDYNGNKQFSELCQIVGLVEKPVFRPRGYRAILGYLSVSPRSVIDTYSPEMAYLVRKTMVNWPCDVVIASQLATAPYVDHQASPIAILDEVETSTLSDISRSGGRFSSLTTIRHNLMWWKAQHYVRRTVRRFAACTVVSADEDANLHRIAPEYGSVAVIPNGVDTEGMQPSLASLRPNILVYSGALTYGANYDAMRFFVSEILPRIRAQISDVQLEITGRLDGVQLEPFQTSGVTLTGYLLDVRPVIASASACVVPIRIGGGTRLKILEAMALGTPVVATCKGAEGLDVNHDVNILLADGPEEFAAQTVRLLRDPVLRARLAIGGRRLVEAKYDWAAIGDQFNQLVSSVATRQGRN